MDLEAVRASLPGMLRDVFGEPVTILAMREGKMSAVADDTRPRMDAVPARYDLGIDIETLGTGRKVAGASHADDETPSISIALDRLAWQPRPGDHVIRTPKQGGGPITYRVTRPFNLPNGVLLLYLQRI
ncbi:hypothetical protein IFT84_20550 [Rhizobium sp. CFBP 8762]|uniref:hypothetical protein n=1 Tax=Rhizobium sp. CFBP 8762 TaxID=2775279 RepID=UPI00178325BF|nr:hypothetical protein [Rhizobium sp. CFBP 8762]MBD8556903.1 hypothetical protein [Rhizobium sp. CFBP 8762]